MVIGMELTNTDRNTLSEAARVLLVEDNEPLAEVTAEFLRNAGLEVQVASTGREALASVVTFGPDIVLCDLRLPDMTGFDIKNALRNSPVTKNALFVIHSAYSETDIDVDVSDGDLFLSKPLTPEKVERLLELSRRPRPEGPTQPVWKE